MVFSLNTAYHIRCNLHWHTQDQTNWKVLWRFKSPLWQSLFLWFLSHNYLITQIFLLRRGISSTNACLWCHRASWNQRLCLEPSNMEITCSSYSPKDISFQLPSIQTWIDSNLANTWEKTSIIWVKVCLPKSGFYLLVVAEQNHP